MHHRRAPAGLVLAFLVLSSGCIGFLAGEEPATFEADPVEVADARQSGAGYETVRVGANTATQSFTVAGETRNVTVTNHVASYQRAVDLGPLGEAPFARFTVLATPQVEVLGQTLNPVEGLSNRDLALRLQSQYDSIEDVRFVGNRTVEILGEPRTVSRFDATTTVAGVGIDLALHVTKFQHGGDFVVAIAVYPARLDGEAARVEAMLRGIQHETGD
ncbi:DUF6517 family protein [Salinirubellus sp. GCM10025818]|uniref:DUF6517 family protein n=1 Tax=Salinirubellus TaxID=2162630 RepID=UPI0030D17DE1